MQLSWSGTVLLSVPFSREYQQTFVYDPPNIRGRYLAGEADGGTINKTIHASFGFLCNMVEVFPDRDMFIQEEQWLSRSRDAVSSQESKRRYATSKLSVLFFSLLINRWLVCEPFTCWASRDLARKSNLPPYANNFGISISTALVVEYHWHGYE